MCSLLFISLQLRRCDLYPGNESFLHIFWQNSFELSSYSLTLSVWKLGEPTSLYACPKLPSRHSWSSSCNSSWEVCLLNPGRDANRLEGLSKCGKYSQELERCNDGQSYACHLFCHLPKPHIDQSEELNPWKLSRGYGCDLSNIPRGSGFGFDDDNRSAANRVRSRTDIVVAIRRSI